MDTDSVEVLDGPVTYKEHVSVEHRVTEAERCPRIFLDLSAPQVRGFLIEKVPLF